MTDVAPIEVRVTGSAAAAQVREALRAAGFNVVDPGPRPRPNLRLVASGEPKEPGS